MTDKVQPLFPGQAIPGTPNDETVELLEHILARAKAGEVISVAIAGCTSDNAIVTCFEVGDRAMTLLGATTHLLNRINRALED